MDSGEQMEPKADDQVMDSPREQTDPVSADVVMDNKGEPTELISKDQVMDSPREETDPVSTDVVMDNKGEPTEELISQDEFTDSKEESLSSDPETNSVWEPMEPISDDQVMNTAGGYVWEVDDMKRFLRFLCLGVEGGTYYVNEQELALENAQCIKRIAESDNWQAALDTLVRCSVEGRAAKQNPTLFALAYFCRQNNSRPLKRAAYRVLDEVCRIPTHLFQFVDYCQKVSENGRGWGRAHREALTKWYAKFSEDPLKLAMHVTKYKNRCGWSHADILRLCHPTTEDEKIRAIMRYAVRGLKKSELDYLKEDSCDEIKKIFAFLTAVEVVRKAKETSDVISLIEEHHLVREHIPNHLLNDASIWKTLLPHMPMTALIRNLNKLSQLELLKEGSDELDIVTRKLGSEDNLRQAKIHPFNVLVALSTYKEGKGEKGKLEWPVVEAVVKALDEAFYKSFKFVEPTNQRYLLAVDVSGSMSCPILGSPSVMASCASAAMAMVTLRTEKCCDVVAFSHTLEPLPLKADMKLETVMNVMEDIPMGSTDCSLPMIHAQTEGKEYDVFIVYTDNETWFGKIHPSQALKDYRIHVGRPEVKLIVVAMTSTGFTIADPADGGMLDVCGFDSAAPEVMKNFALGLI